MSSEHRPRVVSGAERVLPFSEDAEKGVLGSVLLDPERLMDLCVAKPLGPDAFYLPAHRMIYDAYLDMHAREVPIDTLTLRDKLTANNQLDKVGGNEALENLVDSTPTAAYAEHYIDIVYEKYLIRELITRSTKTIQQCYSPEETAANLLARAEEELFSLSSSRRQALIPWNELVRKAIADIEKMAENHTGISGLPVGFADIDDKLKGFKKTEMIILAARPSMGKTSLALNIAEHVAVGDVQDHERRGVLVFSLEMSADSLIKRMLCCRAHVPLNKLMGGYLGKEHHGNLIAAADALSKAQIFIDDAAGLEVYELRARARRLKRRYPSIELIVIDYLQLANHSQYAREGRQRETAAISGALKGMAKELDLPVLVLSQLSRAPENRDRHAIPRLSDLRDSGAIEQDADVVMLLRRPSRIPGDDQHDDDTLAILDVAKNRNGPCGEIELSFTAEFTRFDSRARPGVDERAPQIPQEGFV